MKSYKCFAFSLLVFAGISMAEDRAELEGTSIIGNRELPKILYVAPWKNPSLNDLNRPFVSLMDEVMSPLDREIFSREVRYYEIMNQQDIKQ